MQYQFFSRNRALSGSLASFLALAVAIGAGCATSQDASASSGDGALQELAVLMERSDSPPSDAVLAEFPGSHKATPAGAPLSARVSATAAQRWNPSVVTIGAGGTVTWSWSTGEAHNVAGNGFSSNVSETGSFSFTFGAPGSYSFTCEVHPLTMNGTVNVQ